MRLPTIVTAAILVIGDEILSGRTKDKNIGYIADYLTALGIDLREVRVVPDVEAEIVAALNALRARYDYVFTTGGIGPTHDDITAECVAKAFGVPHFHPERGRADEGAPGQDRRRAQRGAHAHDAHPRRRRARRQQGVRRARLLDRQCHRHGRHPARSCRRMLDDVGPKLKGGTKILSETIRADAKEGDLGTPLGEVAKANPETIIGSYPFFDEKSGPNTNIVVRSRDAVKLKQAKVAVEDMLKKVKAQLGQR